MNGLFQRIKQKVSGEAFLLPALLGVTIALGLYAYLGIFSRYTSDDYCLSAFYYKPSDFFTNLIERYNAASSRYSNIMFIGAADKLLGWYNPAILPALMILLFVLGLYLLLEQIRAAFRWTWSRGIILYAATMVVFLSLLQSPNLFQTLYWRAGMTSHFAPVVFMPFLGAFLMGQIRLAAERTPPAWVYAACFLIPFLIGGLSEPPATLMVAIFTLAFAGVWGWGTGPARRSTLQLLSSSLAGAFVSLMLLAFSPANLERLGEPTMGLVEGLLKTFHATLTFAIDHVRSLPLPVAFTILAPFLLFHVKYANSAETLSENTRKQLALLLPVVLLTGYVLIAASFFPGVYGQSFPAARARFAGVTLLVCTFMTSGAILGILVSNVGIRFLRSPFVQRAAMIAFVLVSLYPLRTVTRLLAEVPTYQQRAFAWDQRDAQIRAMKADGVQDLTVPFLISDPVQDLGDYSEFRLNRCAADIYDVNSILALPMDEE